MSGHSKHISQLRNLGFKFRNKNRYVLYSKFNQFIAVYTFADGYLLEVDGKQIISNKLKIDKLILIITELFLE